MASMGDDQEENIEMWKIKKVRAPPRGFFVFCFLSLSERRALLVLVVFNDDDDDDDDVFLRRKPRDDVVSFRSLSLSLSRPRRPLFFLSGRDRTALFDKTEDDGAF